MRKAFRSCLVLFIACSIFACNTQPKSVGDNSAATAKPDTVKPAMPELSPEMQKLLTHFKDGSMPLSIDSIYMTKAIKGDSLGSKEVKMLVDASMIKVHDVNGAYENALGDFYTIDSVKAAGNYPKWARKLDIGMARLSNAYALQKIHFNDSTIILLWALKNTNEEADPTFDETTIYCSLLKHNRIFLCFTIGAMSVSADPPASGQTLITSKLDKDGALTMDETTISSDSDDSIGDCDYTHFKFVLSNGELKFVSEKKRHKDGRKVKE